MCLSEEEVGLKTGVADLHGSRQRMTVDVGASSRGASTGSCANRGSRGRGGLGRGRGRGRTKSLSLVTCNQGTN